MKRRVLPVAFLVTVGLLSAGCSKEGSTTPDGTPPGRITDLRAVSSNRTTVTLEWTAVGDDGVVGRAASYDLRYSPSPIDSSRWEEMTRAEGEPAPAEAGRTERFTLGGLKPDHAWYFCLEAADDASNRSGLSNVATIATLPFDTIPPAPVTDLAIVSTTEESVTVGWTSVGDDGMDGEPDLYEIRWSLFPIDDGNWGALGDTARVPAGPPGTPATYRIRGLLPDIDYHFAVKALDLAGTWGSLSNVVSARTVDTTPPSPVADLVVTMPQSPAELLLAWTAPGDDESDEAAVLYDIRYATEPLDDGTWESALTIPDAPTPRGPGAMETMPIADLDIDRYYFAIKSRDEAGNWSPISNVAVGIVPLRLEAENYVDSLNIGGYPIQRVSCTGASGYKAADGVDYDGDWIRIAFELLGPVCFTDSLRTAADLGVVQTFAIEYVRLPDETVVAADTMTTVPGAGVG